MVGFGRRTKGDFEEQAVKLNPEAWSDLAKIYASQGRVADQHRDETHAAALLPVQKPARQGLWPVYK